MKKKSVCGQSQKSDVGEALANNNPAEIRLNPKLNMNIFFFMFNPWGIVFFNQDVKQFDYFNSDFI